MAPKNPKQILLMLWTVLGGRIRIPISGTRMLIGLPDPDPLVRSTDPDPSLFS
jgi:hypothetical protein